MKAVAWTVLGLALFAARADAQPAPTPEADAALVKPRSSWAKCDARPAIESGLAWLARHQEKDGSWSCAGFASLCAGDAVCEGVGYDEYHVGVTALATLALLGYGAAPGVDLFVKDEVLGSTPNLGEAATRALEWLATQQDAEGCLGPRPVAKMMYNHAIATYALAEAAAMTGDADRRARAQRAVDWLVAARNPRGVWRYTPRSGENDTSVTGWCVSALYMARLAGLKVPDDPFRDAKRFLEEATSVQFQTGYRQLEDAGIKVVVQGKNDASANHPTMAAIALFARTLIDGPKLDARYRQGAVKLLGADPPRWDPGQRVIDSYYWYHATGAIHAAGVPDAWKAWHKALVAALTLGQGRNKTRCDHGSWSSDTPAGMDRWGFEGGRVCTTAIGVLALEAPIRYGPLPPVDSLEGAGGEAAGGPAGAAVEAPAVEPLREEERALLEDWTAALGGPTSSVAEESILRFGARAAPVLRARLRDPDASVRRTVRELLARLGVDPGAGGGESGGTGAPAGAGDPQADPEYATPHSRHLNRYREDLRSADVVVRERALGAFAALKSTWAVEPLVAALQVEEQGPLRAQIVQVLLQSERAAVVREFRKAVNAKPNAEKAARLLEYAAACEELEILRCAVMLFLHPEAEVSNAAYAVLRAQRKTAVPAIVEGAKASRGAARGSLVALMGRIGDRRFVPYLCSLCPAEPQVNPERDQALDALRAIGLPGIPGMIDALSSSSRKHVVGILRELSYQRYDYDEADKWKAWLKENRDRVDEAERRRFPE